MLLLALDVDGTLSSAGGPITGEQLQRLDRPDVIWGILSSRSKQGSEDACRALGVEPAFYEVCRVDMRSEELKLLREQHPDAERYIYVADRDIDRQEALRASWEFYYAFRFDDLLEELSYEMR